MDAQMALYRKCSFSELQKIMANKVTFVGFRGGATAPIAPPIRPYWGGCLNELNEEHSRIRVIQSQ